MLRRLGLAVPLAVLVATLVHLALFGAEHAPGAAHASDLLTNLGAGLALAALGGVLFAALSRRRDERSIHKRRTNVSPLELALGGTLAYAVIELAEGHTPLGGGAWQIALTVGAAFLVSLLARSIGNLLRISGAALAAFATTLSRSPAPLVLTFAFDAPRGDCTPIAGSSRGRAPPPFS